MNKYLVIGNPIEHSLSPVLHNHWFKSHNENATYEKKKVEEDELNELISEVRSQKISGINVTVPFKNSIIKHLDILSEVAEATQSVNTIYRIDNKICGHNTDCGGFERSLIETKFKTKDKVAFILGAGGVTSSIIYALKVIGLSKIFVTNRTKQKAENLKKLFPEIKVLDWGQKPSKFDIVINTTSVGLKENDKIELNFNDCKDKLFYDLIYSRKTSFLKERENTNFTKNGMSMFIFQAQIAYESWFGYKPHVEDKLWELLSN